jgi:hypothetical protein
LTLRFTEFKKMWSEIRIPDETDLPKALETAGLKTMEVFEKKVTSEVRNKTIVLLYCIHTFPSPSQRDQRHETRELRSPILIYRISIFKMFF